MVLTKCNTCGVIFHVLGRFEEVKSLLRERQWARSFPCVAPGCRGRAGLITPDHLDRKPREVQLHDYYRALHGNGLSEEGRGPAEAEHVRELLLTKRIDSVSLEPAGSPERVILKGLVLEDGTKLHFAASSKGACIYYVEEATNVEISPVPSEADSSDDAEDGVQDGLPSQEVSERELPDSADELHGPGGPAEQSTNQVATSGLGGWDNDNSQNLTRPSTTNGTPGVFAGTSTSREQGGLES